MSVINISNQQEFSNIVTQSEKPVLVDFWAPWCGPCKMVGPEVDAVADAVEGKAVVVKVNVDDNPQLAGSYNVMGVPTLLMVKDGREVNRIVGYRPRKEILSVLEKMM